MASPSPLSLSLVSSSQPEIPGWVVQIGSLGYLVSVSYILYTGDNVAGYANSDFINGTVTLGAGLEPVNTSGPNYTYIMQIASSLVLPTRDYFLIAYGTTSTGSVTPYQQTPLVLPFSPAPVKLVENGCFINQAPYGGFIFITFPQIIPAGFSSSDFSYTAAIQYTDGTSTSWVFDTVSGLSYDSTGVKVNFPTAIMGQVDECYCAVQVSRTSMPNITSELSNTVAAIDTRIPSPPTNLELVGYDYLKDPQEVAMRWLAGIGSDLTDITAFKVYRQIGSGSYVQIGNNVPYVSQTTIYTYLDTTIPSTTTAGTQINYYIKSVNDDNVLSTQSNTLTVFYVKPSSAPTNLTGSSLGDSYTSTASIELDWGNPTTVIGTTGQFIIELYTNSTGSGTPTYTYQKPYIAGSSTAYQLVKIVPFNSNFFAKVRLETVDPNNPSGVIIGLNSSLALTTGFAPIITDINGTDNNTIYNKDNKLTSFNVYSFSQLTGTYITTLNTVTKVFSNVILIPTSSSIQSDPNLAHYGSFIQTFNVSTATGVIAINISTGNLNALAANHFQGPYAI